MLSLRHLSFTRAHFHQPTRSTWPSPASAELTEEVITEPAKAQIKLKADNVDIAYQPIFQSGGNYDLKLSAASDDNLLHAGVILVSLGTRYSSYCANVARTYIIDGGKEIEAQYAAVLAAQEAAITALVDGAPANAPFEAAVKVGWAVVVVSGGYGLLAALSCRLRRAHITHRLLQTAPARVAVQLLSCCSFKPTCGRPCCVME